MADDQRELLANIAPFGLRMQSDLKDRVKSAAEANNRSMNAEIIARLDWSFDRATEERAEFLKLVHDQDNEIRALKNKLKAPTDETNRLTGQLKELLESHERLSSLFDTQQELIREMQGALARASGQAHQQAAIIVSLCTMLLNLESKPDDEVKDFAQRMRIAASLVETKFKELAERKPRHGLSES